MGAWGTVDARSSSSSSYPLPQPLGLKQRRPRNCASNFCGHLRMNLLKYIERNGRVLQDWETNKNALLSHLYYHWSIMPFAIGGVAELFSPGHHSCNCIQSLCVDPCSCVKASWYCFPLNLVSASPILKSVSCNVLLYFLQRSSKDDEQKLDKKKPEGNDTFDKMANRRSLQTSAYGRNSLNQGTNNIFPDYKLYRVKLKFLAIY